MLRCLVFSAVSGARCCFFFAARAPVAVCRLDNGCERFVLLGTQGDILVLFARGSAVKSFYLHCGLVCWKDGSFLSILCAFEWSYSTEKW